MVPSLEYISQCVVVKLADFWQFVLQCSYNIVFDLFSAKADPSEASPRETWFGLVRGQRNEDLKSLHFPSTAEECLLHHASQGR